MRLAILSDIHSNIQALERAVAEIKNRDVDHIYCLGDIVGYGAHPNECVDLIQSQAKISLLGNHDQATLDPSEARNFTEAGRIAIQWTNKILTQENKDFLRRLSFQDEAEDCTFVHASPATPQSWDYVLSLQDAAPQFDHFQGRLCFIGHTHVPFICGEDLKTFRFKNGIRFLINVGSVGQPRDGNPQLSFGILDTKAWTYENVRCDYDLKSAADAIVRNNLPRQSADRLFHGI